MGRGNLDSLSSNPPRRFFFIPPELPQKFWRTSVDNLLTGFLFWLIIKVEMSFKKLKFNFIRIKEGILTYLFRKTSQRSLMAEACK